MNERNQAVSIGQKLRMARESKELTIDELAKNLLLKKEWLEEIEKDNYNFLSSFYVKGYLRAYAKKVDLCSEEIVRACEFAPVNSTSKQDYVFINKIQMTAGHHLIRFTTYSIISLLVILVMLWWG